LTSFNPDTFVFILKIGHEYQTTTDPGILLFMFIMSFIFVIVLVYLSEANLCMFLSLAYICIPIWDPVIKKGGCWQPSKRFNTAIFYFCPKPGPGFATSYAVVLILCL